MRSYSEREVFTDWAVACWRFAEAARQRIHPSVERELRCHELVRAVSSLLMQSDLKAGGLIEYADGHYGAVNHSWINLIPLPTKFNSRRVAILDVYAVGSLPMVQLVSPYIPGVRVQYIPGKDREDIDTKMARFLVDTCGPGSL